MGKSDLSGIERFFSDLEPDQLGDQTKPTAVKEREQHDSVGDKQDESRTVRRRPNVGPKTSQTSTRRKGRTDPVRLPTGRPRGSKEGDGLRRAKTSLWLDAELLEAYRERVYTERCHLGELVERALRQYQQENW